MERCGYLRHENGEPEMQTDWYCGRITGRSEAYSWLEQDYNVGDTVRIHKGFGRYQTYKVADIDECSAILIAIN